LAQWLQAFIYALGSHDVWTSAPVNHPAEVNMVLRPLTAADAEAYQALRLRSLREHPEAFAPAVEEEQTASLETVARRLERSSTEGYILGAFEGEKLVGILTFRRWEGLKIRHRASIGGMYVSPESRGRGIGKALLEEAIEQARALTGVEDLILAVTVGNARARSFYLTVGFTPVAIDPRYIKVGERYFDIEWMQLRLTREQSERPQEYRIEQMSNQRLLAPRKA
jgi:ribosomal protein S18 acetylase RimI-like enzyme